MRLIDRAGLLLAAVLLGGCDDAAMVNRFAPVEDVATAKKYIGLLRDGGFEQIEKDMDPALMTSETRQKLGHMAALIAPQRPTSVKVVGAQVSRVSRPERSYTDTSITLEYQFPGKWLIANVVTRKADRDLTIIGLHVKPIDDSLENINRFTLAGKSPLQYGVLGLAVAIPVFILCTVIVCARTRIARLKWLWILCILFGVGQFGVNWTTGEYQLQPIGFQLLGAGAFAPPYGPWTLTIALPLGAVIFLVLRERLAAGPGEAPSPPAAVPPPSP